MKKSRKLFNFIISIIIALSFTFTAVACDDEEDEGGTTGGSIASQFVYNDGIHEGSNPEDTSTNFLVDGKTDYVLVTPKNATARYPANAKIEFNILFEKATGITMVTTTDDKVEYSQDAKYISLGQTTLVDQAGIGKDSNGNQLKEYSYQYLTREGFKIITKGNTVFLYTVHEDGLFNAVHKFMEINFNYKFFYSNCMTIDNNVKNLKLKNFNVTEVPDVHRVGITGSNVNGLDQSTPVPVRDGDTEGLGAQASTELQYRNMRYGIQVHANYWMQMNVHMRKNAADVKPYGGTNYYCNDIHNEFYWVDYFNSDYLTAWYASDRLGEDLFDAPTANQMAKWSSQSANDRICYTANGDKEAYAAGIRHFANKVIYSLKAYNTVDYPNENVITFTMGDSGSTCMCSSCQSIYNQCGGAYSITTLLVCNDIMELVAPWLEEQKTNGDPYNAYREDFDLLFFAYNKLTAPPVSYNEETKTYEPYSVKGMLDDTASPVKLNEYVGVYHAEGNTDGRFDGYQDVLSPQVQNGVYEILGWKTLFDEDDPFPTFWTWYNSGNITSAGLFSDPMTTYSKNYWTLKAIVGSDFVYAAHQYTTNYTSGWTSLFYYLMAELRWDCTQDAEQLTNEYFSAMYGPAADSMKALMNAMQDHWTWIMSSLVSEGKNPGRGTAVKQSTKYWPYQATSKWIDFIDMAYEDIEYLKAENPTLYSAIDYRIRLEAACPYYTILYTYGASSQKPYSDAKEAEYKAKLLMSIEWAGGMGIENVAQ